jgi:4-hydroxy-3-polyprenylbenzoate decarboxylase
LPSNTNNNRIIVAVTGASGSIYAKRFIEVLSELDYELHLIFSDNGRLVWHDELNTSLPAAPSELKAALIKQLRIKQQHHDNIIVHAFKDIAAPVSSGSFITRGMVVIPASMGTVGGIAHGISRNLIERSADVILKEGRKLVIVPRESPFSLIHLQNLTLLSQAGARIVPAMPAFYTKPKTIDDIVDFVVGKTLDSLDIHTDLYKRWH